MYIRISLLLGLALLINVSARSQDQGNLLVNAPNVQKRVIGSFHAIEVSSAIDLVLKQGDEEALAVSASDPALRDRIITRVENGVLLIYMNDKGFHWNWGWTNRKLKAFVSFKTLNRLSASGSSDVYVDGSIHAADLSISLSGASDFKGGVQASELELHQSGSSDAVVNGTANNAEIHLSGSSDFKGFNMTVDVCTVEASGSSDTQITVNKELSVSASGSSDVYYKGQASVTRAHTSGSSSVSKRS
jgi:hypothetical protein